MRAVICLLLLCSTAWSVTVNVVPRGDGQGSVGIPDRKWGEGWFDQIGLSDTNRYVTSIDTNMTASSTYYGLPTSKAVWDLVQGVTGSVSAFDIARWDEAHTWVTNRGPSYVNWDSVYNWWQGETWGDAYEYYVIPTYPPATPGDNSKLPTWYVVKEYVDDNTGTNIVSTNDRERWDATYTNMTDFLAGLTITSDYGDFVNAWGWASTFNLNNGTAYTFDQGATDDKLPNWQQVTNYVAANTGTNTVTDADRANWDWAYTWSWNISNDVTALISKSTGWDTSYTWYVTDRGDAADRDMAIGTVQGNWLPSDLLDWLNVRAYVEGFTATGVVTETERDRWDDTWTEVYDGHPDGNGIVNDICFTNWDNNWSWYTGVVDDVAYMASRTSVWDSATAPDLDTVMTEGNWTTNSLGYTNVDFTISNTEGTNGKSRDVVIKAGASVDASGAEIELTGANNDGQGDGENNGWVEITLHSWAGNSSPKVRIKDGSDADREITISFNGDQAEVISKDDLKIYANEDSGNYIKISNDGYNIAMYSDNDMQFIAEDEFSLNAYTNIILNAGKLIQFDFGAQDVDWGLTTADFHDYIIENAVMDCDDGTDSTSFLLPTNDPGVNYRLWSSNGVVHYTGSP